MHTDTDPSLSIDQRGDRVFAFCHSHDCTQKDVAQALGLRYDEFWDEPLPMCPVCGKPTKQDPATGEWAHPYCAAKRDGRPIPRDHIQRRPPVKARPKIGRLPARVVESPAESVVEAEKTVAEYDHINDDGEVIARSVRKEKWVRVDGDDGEPQKRKRFYQLFTDGTGGWARSKSKLPAGTVVPIYRLPEVRLSILAGEPVHLVEGHKDAGAIVEMGGEGTTNIDGAKNLHKEDTDQLAGADVITVVDRDLAGYLRGLKSLELLDGVAASNRVMLPATTERKSDVFDHWQAGHGLDDFVEASKDELQRLVILERADAVLRDVQTMPAEILVREERAEAASSDEERLEEHQAADRWSIEIGKQQFQNKLLPMREELIKVPGCTREDVRRIDEIISQVRRLAVEAYGRRQLVADHELAEMLGLVDHDDPAALSDPPPNNVVDLRPKAEYRADSPAHRIPMASSSEFAYSLGDDGFERGVWMATKSTPWMQLAEMPYVHRRIVRRDGHGKRTGLNYLLSAEEGDRPLQFDLTSLKDGSWANRLGIELSQDLKVISAVATAIIYAAKDAELQEATPDIDRESGKIIVPASVEQFFDLAPVAREDALQAWRKIVDQLALAPKMAQVVGASAIAPFLKQVLGESHVVSMVGGMGQGKSILLRVAAGIWGDSVHGNGPLYGSWNTTGQGLPRLLGTLRVLPAFRDETGLSGQPPNYFAELAYQLTEGIDRLRFDRETDVRMDKPWWGILFTTGNEQFADGCNRGRYQGVPRRIVDLAGPFTLSAAHGDLLYCRKAADGRHGLLEQCYGHLGAEIVDRYDVEQVIAVMDRAAELITAPPEAKIVAPLVQFHVAGALMIDEVLGTGTTLTDAAVEAAQTYLNGWLPPEREADQVIDLVFDSIAREPSRWPTKAEYAEHLRAFSVEDDGHTRLPQAGVARDMLGVRDDDDRWVGVFSTAWHDLMDGQEINRTLACEQLADDGILRVQQSQRRRKNWTSYERLTSDERIGTKGARLYKLYLPDLPNLPAADDVPGGDDSTPQDELQPTLNEQPAGVGQEDVEQGPKDRADTPDVAGDVAGRCGSVAGDVAGANTTVTRGVADVAGQIEKTSRSVRAGSPGPQSSEIVEHTEINVHARAEEGTVHTAESTRGWGAAEFDRAVTEAIERNDQEALDALQQLMAAYEDAFRAAHRNTTTEPQPGADPAPSRPAPAQERPQQRLQQRLQHGRADQRWAAPAAVLGSDLAYVAGQAPVGWQAAHLGELAMLVRPDRLRLGYGGDRDRLPDPGQIWLTAEALERLGMPTKLDWPDGRSLEDRDKAEERLFAPIQLLPAVAEAKRAGWEISTADGDVRTWTRIKHPELLPGGAYLVFTPWHPQPITGLTDDPSIGAVDLAERLATFADAMGGPFVITPAITGVRLVERTRPARRDAESGVDDNSRRRRALLASEKPELPPFLADRSDARFTGLETDFGWWRLWEPNERSSRAALTEEERGRAWVHGYDRKGSYLSVWERLDLGLEGLRHREGAEAVWPGNEKPGFFLVDEWDWTEWGLPDPADAAGARVENGRRWVTSHTLRQLKAHGIEPAVHESWTWDVSGSYLEQAAKIIKAGLKRSQEDPDAAWMRPMIKQVYTRTGGKFAAHRTNSAYHLHRPDWWYHIVAASRTAILYQLTKAFELSRALPVAVDRDAVFYVSDEADPAKAWPGDPKKLADVRMGDWRPIGSARLQDWGPKHLIDSVGASGGGKKSRFDFRQWRYTDAIADLSLDRPGE